MESRKVGLNHHVSTDKSYSVQNLCQSLHIRYDFDERLLSGDGLLTEDHIRATADDAAAQIRSAVYTELISRNHKIVRGVWDTPIKSHYPTLEVLA